VKGPFRVNRLHALRTLRVHHRAVVALVLHEHRARRDSRPALRARAERLGFRRHSFTPYTRRVTAKRRPNRTESGIRAGPDLNRRKTCSLQKGELAVEHSRERSERDSLNARRSRAFSLFSVDFCAERCPQRARGRPTGDLGVLERRPAGAVRAE